MRNLEMVSKITPLNYGVLKFVVGRVSNFMPAVKVITSLALSFRPCIVSVTATLSEITSVKLYIWNC
jgi:hypothetical protein